MLTVEPRIESTIEDAIDLTAIAEEEWRAKARCRDGWGTLAHLFFSDEVLDIARAKAICAKCSVATECLASALERGEMWGVWGGELLHNGRVVAHKRPRGRPPRHPRPEPVVDEVPLPPHYSAPELARV
jgi:hypothetical protein